MRARDVRPGDECRDGSRVHYRVLAVDRVGWQVKWRIEHVPDGGRDIRVWDPDRDVPNIVRPK